MGADEGLAIRTGATGTTALEEPEVLEALVSFELVLLETSPLTAPLTSLTLERGKMVIEKNYI